MFTKNEKIEIIILLVIIAISSFMIYRFMTKTYEPNCSISNQGNYIQGLKRDTNANSNAKYFYIEDNRVRPMTMDEKRMFMDKPIKVEK